MSQVKNLCKTLGTFQIDIKEWDIADQGVTVLWGASGSGKTSAVRALIGLDPCPQLEWWFEDTDIAQLHASERSIGAVFQRPSLFPHMTVFENLRFPLRAQRRAIDERGWLDLIDLFELKAILHQKSHVLSGGEQQRVALARAVFLKPRILILDEPFSALDRVFKQQAFELLENVMKTTQIPILLVSHDIEDIHRLAQRVVLFDNGQIKASQTAEDFLKGV